MRQVIVTNRFEKEVKLCERRGKKMSKLKEVIKILESGEPFPHKYRDHLLVGNYSGRRECHLEPDWLLIYKLNNGTVLLERTGTHSDLF